MSQSRALQRHIQQLQEIRGVLHTLKNMAFMELHRLGRRQRAQRDMVVHIETVAADFLHYYPAPAEAEPEGPAVVVVIGSERGFCGNFNESLIERLPALLPAVLIGVGQRLCARLENAGIACTALPGANGCDEIDPVLGKLIETVDELQHRHDTASLSVLSHCDEHGNIKLERILPPFASIKRTTEHGPEPLLNLPPHRFLLELAEHYLLAALQDQLSTSLTAENNRRLQHLDDAVTHLDRETTKLRRISQVHRQEEITEEIEVILLNAINPEAINNS